MHYLLRFNIFQDDFRYLLVTIEYEPFAHLGRPHSISYNAVKELFGKLKRIQKYKDNPSIITIFKASFLALVHTLFCKHILFFTNFGWV